MKSHSGQIITFYSYKGGTGRTMALANVACLLSRNSNVLVIDWDLEAPGLHHYFKKYINDWAEYQNYYGVIDLFIEFQDYLNEHPKLIYEDHAKDLFKSIEWNKYIYTIKADQYTVDLIKAGLFDQSYGHRISTFKWEELFERSPWLFQRLAAYFEENYGYVLIDSRTGYSDTSGICTMLLPEKLISVFTPNDQSISGAIDFIKEAADYRRDSDDLRPLIIYPLASRIDSTEDQRRRKWRKGVEAGEHLTNENFRGYQKRFEETLSSIYKLDECDLEDYFSKVQIQHNPPFSYGEKVAVLEEEIDDRFSMTESYEIFANKLLQDEKPWAVKKKELKMPIEGSTGRAFIIRPFGEKSNTAGDAPIDFDKVDRELISVALAQVGLTGGTTGEFVQQGNIRTDMFRQLLSADLVITDISIHNANAFYELGIRHALRNQYTVMIKSKVRGDSHVFDLKADRYLPYNPDKPAAAVDDLIKTINSTLESESSDSPVFQLFPGLKSFDPSQVVVVPLKFREKVAQEAADPEELVKLLDIVAGKAWETEGLRIIGRALFKLSNHDVSSKIWERVREFDMFDLEANHKLATNYQKLEDFILSEQAAIRALKSSNLSDWDSAETYALIASNNKTQWHGALESKSDLVERQRSALASPFLEQSYEFYRKGFERHLSHYYSGLNAVAMLSIQIELAKLHPDQWALGFKNERFAELELEERIEHLSKLIAATDLAIETSVRNYPEDEWARISRADLMLLTSNNPDKVKLKYEKCSTIAAFRVTFLRRELKIYQDLALFQDNVEAALEAVKSHQA